MDISVILPTHNREAYLSDAIQSVLDQSYRGYELIIVDDASTDKTQEIVRPYQKFVTYIRKKRNEGFAYARNTGITAASGKYIAYLDDDDLYYPFKLELQKTILDNNPEIGMVYTDFSAFDEHGIFDEYHISQYHESAYKRPGFDINRIFLRQESICSLEYCKNLQHIMPDFYPNAQLYSGNIYRHYLVNTLVFTNSMMFRKSLIEKAGLQYRKFGMFSDLEFALRLTKISDSAYVNVPTYKLRYHSAQISTANKPGGGLINIRKQRDLLRVTKAHFNTLNQDTMLSQTEQHQQLARLYKAAAIPLISYQSGSRATDKKNSILARKYLSRCFQFNFAQTGLYIMTFLPHLVRRIYFKITTLLR